MLMVCLLVSPTGLNNPGDISLEGIFSQTYPAHIELPVIGPRPPTERTSMILSDLKFIQSLGLNH
jgi:hypothetical protein